MLMPGPDCFGTGVGILGQYLGMIIVPAKTDSFPNDGDYAWGHVVAIVGGTLRRCSWVHGPHTVDKNFVEQGTVTSCLDRRSSATPARAPFTSYWPAARLQAGPWVDQGFPSRSRWSAPPFPRHGLLRAMMRSRDGRWGFVMILPLSLPCREGLRS